MEARSSWINIMVSTVGLSFTTAGKLLTWAAASGRNVKVIYSFFRFGSNSIFFLSYIFFFYKERLPEKISGVI